uniref:Uncharacterized protein n=1 Tax=Biomphalaria glabrata TaxID=6526 RepID=A0A2C9L4V8_BIOGL
MADVVQDFTLDLRNAIKLEVLQGTNEIISSTQLLYKYNNGRMSIATIENETQITVLKQKTERLLRNDPHQHSVEEKVYFDDVKPLRNIKDEVHSDREVPVRTIKDEVHSDGDVPVRTIKDEVHSDKDSSTIGIKDEKQKCTLFENSVQCFPTIKENPDHLETSQPVNLSKKTTYVKYAKNCFLRLPI